MSRSDVAIMAVRALLLPRSLGTCSVLFLHSLAYPGFGLSPNHPHGFLLCDHRVSPMAGPMAMMASDTSRPSVLFISCLPHPAGMEVGFWRTQAFSTVCFTRRPQLRRVGSAQGQCSTVTTEKQMEYWKLGGFSEITVWSPQGQEGLSTGKEEESESQFCG